jgi:hypothetical protein
MCKVPERLTLYGPHDASTLVYSDRLPIERRVRSRLGLPGTQREPFAGPTLHV